MAGVIVVTGELSSSAGNDVAVVRSMRSTVAPTRAHGKGGWSSVGRENHARMKSEQIDVGPAPKRPRRRRGLVAQSDRWIAEHWTELIAAAGPTLANPPASPFVELITQALAQYGDGGPL